MTDEEWKGLETLAEKMLAYYRIPGCAMAVIDEGVHFLSFGARDAETGEPFTEKTVSGIGSCTKSMTAAAALRLEEKGLLSIDEPIASYVPGFAMWDSRVTPLVTLRDMFCHRTGVAGHDGARTAAQYSNVMYAAAGGVMEAVTGKRWETILEEEIFQPLGMTRTFCLMGDAEKENDLASPHRWDRGLHVIPRWNIDMAGPCGSVMSTAEDMAKWLAFHISGGMADGRALLSTSRFLDMHAPQVIMDYPHVRGGRSLGYGLGWRVMEYHGSIVQQHTGKIEGYSAFQPRTIPSSSPCRDTCWTSSPGALRRTGTDSTRKRGNTRRKTCTTIWNLTACRRAPLPLRLPGALTPTPDSMPIPGTASSVCAAAAAVSFWTSGTWKGFLSRTSATTPSGRTASKKTPTSTRCP